MNLLINNVFFNLTKILFSKLFFSFIDSYYSSSSKYFNQSSFGSFVLFVIILIIIFGILSQLRYTQHNGPIPPPNTHYGTGPNPYPHDPYYGGSSYYGGYRPGFWSGSLLGYLLGRNTYYHRPAFGGYYGGHSGYYGGNSGFSNSSPSSPRGSTTRPGNKILYHQFLLLKLIPFFI